MGLTSGRWPTNFLSPLLCLVPRTLDYRPRPVRCGRGERDITTSPLGATHSFNVLKVGPVSLAAQVVPSSTNSERGPPVAGGVASNP